MTQLKVGQVWQCRDQRLTGTITRCKDAERFDVRVHLCPDSGFDYALVSGNVYNYKIGFGRAGRETDHLDSVCQWMGGCRDADLVSLLYDPEMT